RYNSYQVDLAIFASPSNPGARGSVQWTHPNDLTGGDVNPVPLRDGALLYTKYSIDDSFQVHAQVWIQKRPGTAGQALTAPQLWTVGSSGPASVRNITTDLGLDSTSAPVWIGG